MSLAGLSSLTWLLSLARLLALARLLVRGGRRLRLIAELRGRFEPFADRLVHHFRLAGDLLGVFADLPLRLSEAVLGVL